MQEVGWPAVLPGWLLRMQLAVLWGTCRGQHIPPGGTVVPEGDRNGSLLQELGILMGNLVVLLLYLYRVNSAGPCFMVSYTNLCKSLNCQNTNIVGKNPCEIVESLPQQHSLSCSLWLLPILVSTVSLQCLNSLPHSYIICCASNSLYCGCLWIINTPAGRLAGQTEGGERSSVQVGLSSNYPLQTHPSETSACIKYISNWPASSASSKVMRKEVGADRWLGRQYAHMFHFLQILSGNYSKI